MKLVFVYGTLKRGCANHHHLAGQQFVGAAHTPPGFRLFDLGGYPGLVPRDDDCEGVVGEIWSVDATCLAQLDELEGLATNHYRRAPVPLLPPFAERSAEAYFYPHSVEGRRDIGGIWRE